MFVLLVLCLVFVSGMPVDAYTDHGLYVYDFEEGARYDYTLNITSNYPGFEFDNDVFHCYYVFDADVLSRLSIHGVKENVTNLLDVWTVDPFTITNGNTTSNWIAWFTFVPIGNWSLLTELLEGPFIPWGVPRYGSGSYDVIDTDTTWGYLYSENAVKWESGYIEHYEFSKEDGTVNYFFRQVIDDIHDGEEFTTVELKPAETSMFVLEPTTILIVGGVITIVVISLVVIKKRR